MAVGTCAICDAETAAGDRYCSSCGTAVGATVIDLDPDRAGVAGPARIATGGHTRRLGKHALTALAVLVVGVGAWWFVAAGDGPDPSAVPVSERPTPEASTPTSAVSPVPPGDEDAASAIEPERSTGRSDTMSSAAGADPIDPAMLPALDASHLAVAGADGLYLLDLQTGRWSRRDLQNTPSALHGVDGGVVMAGFIGGRLAFAPADGGTPIALGTSDNELLLVGDRNVVVRRWKIAPSEILSVGLDGRSQWVYGPPLGTSTIGVTSESEVIVQAAQTIVGVDPITGTTRPVAEGNGLAVSPDLLVVWTCDNDLRCRTEQVRLDTAERRLLADRFLRWEPLGDGEHRAWASDDGSQPLAYRLVDGWLERVNEVGVAPRLAVADDRSGASVTVEDAALVFRSADGTALAQIASPVGDGVARVALVPAPLRP